MQWTNKQFIFLFLVLDLFQNHNEHNMLQINKIHIKLTIRKVNYQTINHYVF